jgi:toxin-antitoxin system PIN domain toxin
VILVDANLLLYAYHPQAEQHSASRAWLENVLSESELVRFAWLSVWAFLRISTNSRVFEQPLSMAEAAAAVSSWLVQPAAGILEPSERYWSVLSEILKKSQISAPRVTDAALAALAIEHGATLHSTDQGFSRYEGLKWRNPLLAS